jgi:hypothetical protein
MMPQQRGGAVREWQSQASFLTLINPAKPLPARFGAPEGRISILKQFSRNVLSKR